MANDMHTAVQRWLTHIMPDVVTTLLRSLTKDLLLDISKEEGVHGPYSIDIEELRGPITRINFYVMVVPPSMMMATTATFRDAPEDYTPPLNFDMFFFIEDFPSEITDAEHLQQLVDTLTSQFQEVIA